MYAAIRYPVHVLPLACILRRRRAIGLRKNQLTSLGYSLMIADALLLASALLHAGWHKHVSPLLSACLEDLLAAWCGDTGHEPRCPSPLPAQESKTAAWSRITCGQTPGCWSLQLPSAQLQAEPGSTAHCAASVLTGAASPAA